MIANLHIKNIGIIEDLNIDLNKGLNVLTGETGAGKTLIIDSLQIISGGRFSKEMIRRGENNSFVELCMYLPNSEIAEDGNIRDYTDLLHLVILSNLENINAELIEMGIPQSERLVRLNDMAKKQMELLRKNKSLKNLEYIENKVNDKLLI